MSSNPLVTNIPGEKIRLLGDDEENPVDMMGNDDEDDGDISVIVDDVGSDGGDDDDGEDDNGEEDIVDEDDDGDDGDINSDDGIDNTLDRVTSPSARIGAKHGRPSGLQSIDTDDPIQFLADANDGGDMTDDDIDVASMSGNVTGDDEYDDDDDEDPETYLQKFDLEINRDLLLSHHPTQFNKNDTEISVLCQLTRNTSNNVIDPLHKTTPFLTKYEKTRVLGQRAKQLNSGSKPYVVVPEHILDGYIIAQIELAQKRIPFIVERPIHGGGCEYWRVRDLEIL